MMKEILDKSIDSEFDKIENLTWYPWMEKDLVNRSWSNPTYHHLMEALCNRGILPYCLVCFYIWDFFISLG